MGATVDIDIGGTFTDCVVVADGRMVRQKTPTTRYNLSVGFRRAIEGAAHELDLSLEELLAQVDVIRYSTTLAMNTLIERSGPKLGLITTAGYEHTMLIGRARQWADGLHPTEIKNMSRIRKPAPLIPFEMTVGVRERLDCFGHVIIPLSKDDVREKLQILVDRGAKGFVVSLLWSFLNPTHEQLVRDVIEEEYPDRYLGNLPIMLSSEVQPKWHEYPRTNVTILNAYLQTEMTAQLSGLAEELRERGYQRPLTIINNVGGMAKVARTRAVDTYGAGPVAGLFGAGFLSRLYGFEKVIVSDMGGTSFDFGLVTGGEPSFYRDWPVIDRWATESSMIEVSTIGAGGGSIAWLNETMGNRLEVGPRSAGSNPGPACYDLGGTQPTVTDADVVLGYLNPANFLGGKIQLNRDRAIEAIGSIAGPLGMTVEEAAAAIRKVVYANMASVIAKEILLKGHDPKAFVLFAYGGAGPTHCCHYAAHLRIGKIVTFPYASVFCALGGSTMDLCHVYEKSRHIVLFSPKLPGGFLADCTPFNNIVAELKESAFRDMASEGFRPDQVNFSLDLEMRYGFQLNTTRISSPVVRLSDREDAVALFEAFNAQYKRRYGEISATPEAGVNIESYYLIARVLLAKPALPVHELGAGDAYAALCGHRRAYWPESAGFAPTHVYDAEALRAGNVISGPAIVEARDTTYVVPPGWRYAIDRYFNGIIERV